VKCTPCTSDHPQSGLPPAPSPVAGTAVSTQTWNKKTIQQKQKLSVLNVLLPCKEAQDM
jgi:hypothetical protein